MSIVGPRPHAIAMKAGNGMLYGDAIAQYCHRHRIRPGITGWAQANGVRGEIDALSKGVRGWTMSSITGELVALVDPRFL